MQKILLRVDIDVVCLEVLFMHTSVPSPNVLGEPRALICNLNNSNQCFRFYTTVLTALHMFFSFSFLAGMNETNCRVSLYKPNYCVQPVPITRPRTVYSYIEQKNIISFPLRRAFFLLHTCIAAIVYLFSIWTCLKLQTCIFRV